MRTVLRCIAITDVPDVALIPNWVSINHLVGALCVLRSCVNTLCVARVMREGCLCPLLLLTMCNHSRTAANALVGAICSHCVCLATIARRRVRLQAGANRPRGGLNLYSLKVVMRGLNQIFARAN